MSDWTWVEPFAGAAACALRLVGGRDLDPPVAWMGGKRRLARAILDAMGVPDEPPSRVILADAGPWGWVWPLLLNPVDAEQVAAVLRSWSGERHDDLWRRLAALPPAESKHERAAQWLWLQGRSASGVPIWWDGWRLMKGTPAGRPPQDGKNGQRGSWRQCRESPGQEQPAYQKGTAHGNIGGLSDPNTVADRIGRISRAFQRVDWRVHHGDAGSLREPRRKLGTWCYLDPPYVGATGYGWDMLRKDVLDLARKWSYGSTCAAVSEAVPLTGQLAGWHRLDLTAEGGKPEWLTLSRAPARLPERQALLAFPEEVP